MVYVIGNPVWVARHTSRIPALFSLLMFSAGSVASGAILGATLGTIPPVSRAIAVGAVGGIALLATTRDLFLPRLQLPQIRAQVPVHLRTTEYVGPLVYGLILGMGVFTYIPGALFYVYLATLVFLADGFEGLVSGGMFGLAYAILVVVLARSTAASNPVTQAQAILILLRKQRVVAALSGFLAVAALAFTAV